MALQRKCQELFCILSVCYVKKKRLCFLHNRCVSRNKEGGNVGLTRRLEVLCIYRYCFICAEIVLIGEVMTRNATSMDFLSFRAFIVRSVRGVKDWWTSQSQRPSGNQACTRSCLDVHVAVCIALFGGESALPTNGTLESIPRHCARAAKHRGNDSVMKGWNECVCVCFGEPAHQTFFKQLNEKIVCFELCGKMKVFCCLVSTLSSLKQWRLLAMHGNLKQCPLLIVKEVQLLINQACRR